MGKGVGVIASGAHVVLTECSFSSNKAELGGAFYVQGCRADRSEDAPCDATLAAASSRLTVHRSTSDGNTADVNGGLVYATMQAVVSVDGLVADRDAAAFDGESSGLAKARA